MVFVKGQIPHNKNARGKDGYTAKERTIHNRAMKIVDQELKLGKYADDFKLRTKSERALFEAYKNRNNLTKMTEADKQVYDACAKGIAEGLHWLYYAEPDRNDPNAWGERIIEYFEFCAKNNSIPTMEDLTLSLGLSNLRALNDVIFYKTRGDVISMICEKARQIIASNDAKLVARGKIQPVVYIFRSKNLYGFVDKKEIVAVKEEDPIENKSEKELEKRYSDVIEFSESEDEKKQLE